MLAGYTMPILEVCNLSKTYHHKKNKVVAANRVSFSIPRSGTLALVGESGSGKSTIGKMILRLTPPSQGTVLFERQNILELTEKEFFPFRKKMQMVFQDPYCSLNPSMTIKEILEEPLLIHHMYDKNRAKDLLKLVQLPQDALTKFPHQFSGGQRQRIGIARALALNPQFLILDEPVSSLDLSIQAQIINLLKNLQSSLQLTYLLISHDLAIVRHTASHIAVIYLGNIVEIAGKRELFKRPLHPYTQELLAAAYALEEHIKIPLQKEVPQIESKGCPFLSRCVLKKDICFLQKPCLQSISKDHSVCCHRIKKQLLSEEERPHPHLYNTPLQPS